MRIGSCLRRNDGVGAGRNQPPQRTKQHAPSKLPQENSSLPPFRGEVRWGVEGRERLRRSCAPRSPTQPPCKRATPTPLLVSPLKGGRDEFSRGQTLVGARSPSTVPAYAGMTEWAQAGTPHPNAPTNTHQANSPKKIHPSPLSGGRLGGEWNAASEAPSPASTAALQTPSPRLPPRHSCAPSPSFLRPPPRHSCAGRNGGLGPRSPTRSLVDDRCLPPPT